MMNTVALPALHLFRLTIQSRRKSPVVDLESFRQTNLCARHWPSEDTPRHNLSEKTNDVLKGDRSCLLVAPA